MHQIRQVLVRMRMGESNRAIAKAGLMGRNKAAELRKRALARDWLQLEQPLPDDEELAANPTFTTVMEFAPAQAPFVHRHISGDLLHPGFIGMWCNPGDCNTTALQMDKKQHVVSDQSAQRQHPPL